jgi:dephospho-CoA kinase
VLSVGLTGGIGSGKSAVSSLLIEHGAVLIDLDKVARDIVAPGGPALGEVTERFGTGVLQEDGALDRAKMAETVFGDDEARGDLQRIIFAHMGRMTKATREAAMARLGDQAIFVTDAPILLETKTEGSYIGIIVVDAPEELRIARLKEGRGIDEEDARRRMAVQVSDEHRRANARWLISNEGSLDELAAKVAAVWQELVELNATVIALGLDPAKPIPLDEPLPSRA